MNRTADGTWNFLQLARERGADAHVLKLGGRSLAAVYMIGYQVECTLKDYLQQRRKRFPQGGPEGHHLRGLWEAAGFRLHDIEGNRRLFMEHWSTALRYEHSLPDGTDSDALYQGAIELAGYIQKRRRRMSR